MKEVENSTKTEKRKDLYGDWYCVVGIHNNGKTGFYASFTRDYIEFSSSVANYIANRMNESIKNGLSLIDYIKIRRYGRKGCKNNEI